MIVGIHHSPMRFWLPAGYGFDTAGLKFLFDPAKMLNTDGALSLGDNLVTNGDFHDFTMENDANTKGHWLFDSYYDSQEGGDGIENDWSGNSNDLTPTNFETDFEGSLTGSNPAYENGNALELDGVNQYLNISSASAGDFDPGVGDFTVEIWLKYTYSTDYMGLVCKVIGTTGYRVLTGSSSTSIYIALKADDATTASGLVTVGALGDNSWHHLVVVFDRSANALAYVDGVYKGLLDISTVDGHDVSPSGDFRVGYSSANTYFNGYMAEVRYSNVVRTYAEIQRSYGAGKGWTPDAAETDTLYLNSSWKAGIKQVSGADSFSQALTLESGELYRVEITANTEAGGNNARLIFDYGSANMDTGLFDPGDTATKFVYYQRTNGTACGIALYGGNATYMNYYDDIKVQKVQNVMTSDFAAGDVVDYSPSGFDGTTANSLEDDQPTHPSGIEFDGVADYITFGDVLDLSTRDILLTFWLKVADGTPVSEAILIGKYEDANNRWRVTLETDGDLSFYSIESTTVSVNIITTDTGLISNNTWHHVAIALDRSGNGYVYVDGVSKSVTTTTMNGNNQNNAGNFRIGEDAATFVAEEVGLLTMYVYDGTAGAPAALPADYATLISNIYDWGLANRFGYGTDK